MDRQTDRQNFYINIECWHADTQQKYTKQNSTYIDRVYRQCDMHSHALLLPYIIQRYSGLQCLTLLVWQQETHLASEDAARAIFKGRNLRGPNNNRLVTLYSEQPA